MTLPSDADPASGTEQESSPALVLAPQDSSAPDEEPAAQEPTAEAADEAEPRPASTAESGGPAPTTAAATQDTASPAAATEPAPATSPSVAAASAETPAPLPTPAPEPAQAPAAGESLKIWVGGDSMAYTVGAALERVGAGDPTFDAVGDNRGSTGLARPDYFDWPAYLRDSVVDGGYDAGVFMVGANDGQNVAGHAALSDGWREEYRRRAAAAMDLFEGRLLVWVGQPPMQAQGFSATMAAVNAIFASEAALRPWVIYVDAWALLGGGDGTFRTQITLSDGTSLTVREPDGIHLTAAGGRVLADAVLAAVNAAR
jgi:hypothetical protein